MVFSGIPLISDLYNLTIKGLDPARMEYELIARVWEAGSGFATALSEALDPHDDGTSKARYTVIGAAQALFFASIQLFGIPITTFWNDVVMAPTRKLAPATYAKYVHLVFDLKNPSQRDSFYDAMYALYKSGRQGEMAEVVRRVSGTGITGDSVKNAIKYRIKRDAELEK